MKPKTYILIMLTLSALTLSAITAARALDLKIDAAAPAKPVRLRNFYGGYHHNAFYDERSSAFKRVHNIIRESSHKRPAIQYWRCQNIFTYRNDPDGPDGLRYATEKIAGHPYDTERYPGGYNWSKVNEVFDEVVVRTGLTPIVEFNYMPECMAADPTEIGSYGQAIISPPKDFNEWRDLVKNTVTHFQERYGKTNTQNWYWGVWNEANFAEFYNLEKYGYEGFYKLYDYASVPLKSVDPALKIGGPDYTGVHSNTKDFMEHTFSGTNYCSGATGSAADYFSIHCYSNYVRNVHTRTWTMANWAKEIYGEAASRDKKFIVTETAPDWSMSNNPFLQNHYTSAWILAMVDIFLEAADVYGEYYLPEAIHFCGILQGLGKRSLMVQIDKNTDSEEVLRTAPFNTYEALSYLSDERIPVQGCDLSKNFYDVNYLDDPTFNQIRCLATRTPGESIEILVYHFDQNNFMVYSERYDGENPPQPYGTYKQANPATFNVNLAVDQIPFTNARIKKFVIDRQHSNSYSYHVLHANTENFAELDQHDDLALTENKSVSISNGTYQESLTLQENSMTLIIIENENATPAPRLNVAPAEIFFGANNGSDRFTVYNQGTANLTWTAVESPEETWISTLQPATGTLEPGASQEVAVSVQRTGLADGNYSGQIRVNSDGGQQEVALELEVGTGTQLSRIRINAGGVRYTDNLNRQWSGDQVYTSGGFGFEGGQTYFTSDPVSGTSIPLIYQSQRYKMDAYRFDVPNGKYQVILHLAELYFQAANEVSMDVAIENESKISGLDIFREVGHDAALVYRFDAIAVNDGRLDITFSASHRDAKISAIEVIQMLLSDTTPPNPPVNIQVYFP
jgi:hypothetical protein